VSRWTLHYLCLGCREWHPGSPPLSVQGALSYCDGACQALHHTRIRRFNLSRRVQARKRALAPLLAAIPGPT